VICLHKKIPKETSHLFASSLFATSQLLFLGLRTVYNEFLIKNTPAEKSSNSEYSFDIYESVSNYIYGFNILNTGIDFTKLAIEPNLVNYRQLAKDLAYLSGATICPHYIAISINMITIADDIYQGEYIAALKHTLISYSFSIVSEVASSNSELRVFFLAPMLLYSGSTTIYKAISLFYEYDASKSHIAYCELYDYLSRTIANSVFDFNSLAGACLSEEMYQELA
jgi:hypothetical protein